MKLAGVVCVISALSLLFFAPVLWEKYTVWFGVNLNDSFGGGIAVLLFLILTVVVLLIFASNLFSDKEQF